jgi:hypothetical protein
VALQLTCTGALSGCVNEIEGRIARPRVRAALENAGLSKANSECMAERMVDRLSIGQLRKLEKLQGPKRSLFDYVAAVRRVGDAEALKVTAAAAALCATGFAPEKR